MQRQHRKKRVAIWKPPRGKDHPLLVRRRKNEQYFALVDLWIGDTPVSPANKRGQVRQYSPTDFQELLELYRPMREYSLPQWNANLKDLYNRKCEAFVKGCYEDEDSSGCDDTEECQYAFSSPDPDVVGMSGAGIAWAHMAYAQLQPAEMDAYFTFTEDYVACKLPHDILPWNPNYFVLDEITAREIAAAWRSLSEEKKSEYHLRVPGYLVPYLMSCEDCEVDPWRDVRGGTAVAASLAKPTKRGVISLQVAPEKKRRKDSSSHSAVIHVAEERQDRTESIFSFQRLKGGGLSIDLDD